MRRQHSTGIACILLGCTMVVGLARPSALAVERGLAITDTQTPLTAAITRGDTQAAVKLINEGAKVNETGKVNDSPLLVAAMHDNLEAAKLLLTKGADPNLVNALGETPLLYASLNGNAAMLTLLLDQRADPKIVTKSGTTLLMGAATGGDIKIGRAHV